MTRRDLFATVVAAIAGPKLAPAAAAVAVAPAAPAASAGTHYTHLNYSVGFKVSREMLRKEKELQALIDSTRAHLRARKDAREAALMSTLFSEDPALPDYLTDPDDWEL